MAPEHVHHGDDVLPLSLSLVQFLFTGNLSSKRLVLLLHLFLERKRLVHALLLDGSFELVFVLEGLSPHVLLLCHALFVFLATCFASGLLLRKLLLVALQLELDLVLGLALLHLHRVLLGIALLVLDDLGLLDLQFAAKLRSGYEARAYSLFSAASACFVSSPFIASSKAF